jgi:alpha-glucan phosphorylase-like protein
MDSLLKLKALSKNAWWSWNPDALDLFKRLNADVFRATGNNPVATLDARDESVLEDGHYRALVDEVYLRFQRYLGAPYAEGHNSAAYFCMEFGLHESIRLYAGGLGVLAGDHTKAASDLRLPLTAVGLFLRDGYFKQYFDSKGWQLSEYPSVDATNHVFEPVLDGSGDPLLVTVPIGHDSVSVRAWKVHVGRVPLYLLDTDTEPNRFEHRHIARRLYAGNRLTRIQQELILGVGGLRLLRAIGVAPDVYHMNEGHCAFVALELLRERLHLGESEVQAREYIRSRTVFTTHTPVWAGHDRFDPALFSEQLHGLAAEIGRPAHDLLVYGRVNPNDQSEAFTMTVLGLNFADKCNGVSELNGHVARAQWAHLYPDRPVADVPIGHVTNGVHLRSWTSPRARPFLDAQVPGWTEGPEAWQRIHSVPDSELWAYRNMLRHDLIEYVNERVSKQTLPQVPKLDPEVLTIGFARRFATYKRAPLFFRDLERAARILTDANRPVQLIFAGKAHPADDDGKWFIQRIYEYTRDPLFRGRVVFVEGYDMEVGRMLVSGADVWLNTPRRPYEASGTSGQKVAVHGGLNLSILDGWWPEGYNGRNGWAIGADDSAEYKDPEVQDPEDAEFLYALLEREVVPAYYDRNEAGHPAAWLDRMREAMADLPYAFSAERMVREYAEEYYQVGSRASGVAA